ncbi:MAG: sigma-54-dependent Fis family transcriptional regulator, partial [Magnetococcales bacterium]|nr:sigma-54-dependent Fis family transcriptional regulator [Magnetococcales bacterium]
VIIGPEILDMFLSYRWPGNVRELENLIERLTVLSDGEVEREDLPEKILHGSPDYSAAENPSVVVPEFGNIVANLGEGVDFNHEVDSFENQLILSALDSTGWNKNKAAQLLNLNRTTLVEKIKKKGLERMEG